MIKNLLVFARTVALGIGILLPVLASAVGINYRAEANYYSAKESYESHDYGKARDYILKCKELLQGTNFELQYLHVRTAYEEGQLEEARGELETFFEMSDGLKKPVSFSNSVDRLTERERYELTKIINKIDEGIARQVEVEKKRIADEEVSRDLSGSWLLTGDEDNPPRRVHVMQEGEKIRLENDFSAKISGRLVGFELKQSRGDQEVIVFSGNVRYYRYVTCPDYNTNWWPGYEQGEAVYDKARRTITVTVVNRVERSCNWVDNVGVRTYKLTR